MNKDLNKNLLYEAVKTLVEQEDHKHLHLCQHKLFNLYSIGFQYLLYRSTKKPGAYVIRIEDSMLAEKISKRAKDPSSRRFLQAMLIPRKLKYEKSMFYLDFFHIGSWNMTNDIPKEKLQGALIVKNTARRPMIEVDENKDEEDVSSSILSNLPKDYYLTSLKDFVPKTILISYGEDYDGTQKVEFPFIKKDPEKSIPGVFFGKDIDPDKLDD
jgi:hypothetical protein